MQASPAPRRRLIRYDELQERGISFTRQWIKHLEREGKFPRRVPLGPNRVAWVESEIDEYLEQMIARRGAR